MNQLSSILLCEDEPELAHMFSTQLTKAGYDVRVARDGNEAMIALHERRPDLMLLDLVMPDKDGFQVLKDIQADPSLQGIRIFAWSNLTQESEIKQAKDLGVEDYLIKSNYTPSKLVEHVAALLQKK